MTAINAVTDLAVDDGIAVLTLDSPPVNALSAAVRDGLAAGVAAAAADGSVRALVLICAGRTFIAGADIAEFGKPAQGVSLHALIEAIEDARMPMIAAIHGTALGGGLEVALACHYRVAVPSAKCGLPEVKLGLLPGAGGTQRLPRLVGAAAALDMVATGKQVGAKAAKEMGLLDAVIDGDLRTGATAFARTVIDAPLRRVRDLAVAPPPPGLFDDYRRANAKAFRGFDAPEANVEAIEAAVSLSFAAGLARERELFVQLVTGLQSRAQRHVFFAERQANKIADIPDAIPLRPVASVGVIGAGTMGGGIAMNFLNAGVPVTIVEAQAANLDRGVATIRRNYENTAAKGRMTTADVEARMALLTPSLAMDDLGHADLIIEAVFENLDLKKEVFGRLDGIAKPGAILASNTSYLNVDAIAASTTRPQDVVGLHFFSPANVMRLLEVVRGAQTAPDVLATAMATAKKIHKVAVVAGVCDGFIGNRMLSARQKEAQKLILEGAMPWDVDRVLFDFGFPMGPFQMSDLAGLDIGWDAATSKGETLRDRLCEAGRRGQKTGSGFYDYDDKRNRAPSPLVEEMILAFAAERGINRRPIDDAEILERCLYPMVSEGAAILAEGMAQRASDIDIVWINGYGWPVYRGGPMFWADSEGLPKIVAALERFGIAPAPLLVELAAAGRGFGDAA